MEAFNQKPNPSGNVESHWLCGAGVGHGVEFVTLLRSDLRVIRVQRRLGYSIQDGSPMHEKAANAGEKFPHHPMVRPAHQCLLTIRRTTLARASVASSLNCFIKSNLIITPASGRLSVGLGLVARYRPVSRLQQTGGCVQAYKLPKNAPISRASNAGSSAGAKCPPLGIGLHRRTL